MNDVLVVGCGPVGVQTAIRCAQRGLSVLAIDRSHDIFPLPRAIGMDEEIQRAVHLAGAGEALMRCSSPIGGAEFLDAEGERVIGFDSPIGATGPTGYPPMVMFEQPEFEAGLRDAAVRAGVEFRFGLTATAVHQSSDGQSVALDVAAGAGTQETLSARWCVAADGGSSTMRRAIGARLTDLGFDQEWLVLDATALPGCPPLSRLAQQYCDPERVVTLVPGHGTRRRWEFQFRPGETADEMLQPERIYDLLQPWVEPHHVSIDRTAVYRFHAVVAENMRHGSVFLAGDAAHQMPPFNGQGMNSGLRDAENLSWKLAAVAHGQAGPGLLDTYDAERRPHATAQVAHSADAGRLIDALAAGESASTAAGYGGGRPFPHLEHGMVLGEHPMAGRPVPQLSIGDVAIPDQQLGLGFAVVSAPTNPPGAHARAWWAKQGATFVEADRAGDFADLEANSVTLVVRPDRYVAAVSDELDATTRWAAEQLDLGPPALGST